MNRPPLDTGHLFRGLIQWLILAICLAVVIGGIWATCHYLDRLAL